MSTIAILVTDRSGAEHRVTARLHLTLMEVLKDYDLDVEAVCGGGMACATCHVWVDPAWYEKLDPQERGEYELVSSSVHYRPGSSRLSCQVALTHALDGLSLEVAPPD